ncbi:hypothetical protein ACF073_36410 [Streptomyces sp. NPDC015171]|uniref:hypothetical protein n=1 Tax=Streptomyces sp. NPDC015171 TaxID=3364945 RepID=UPI0036F95A10
MTERGDAPPAERLERLRNSLMGTSTRARAERFATQGHTNVLIGASLHAADRLRQGKALSDLERWLLEVLGAALPEQEVKDWGRVYREAVQALGERVAVVPPAISGRPVGTGFALTDLGLVLPAVGQEHAALPNTSIVDREATAAGKNADSPSFVQALPSYGFGATVFQRPRRVSGAAHDTGDPSRLGAERATAPTFRVKLELESFRCRRAVGDQGGGKDEIYWASSTGSDKQSGVGFISQEFGKMKVNETGTFDVSRRTVFEGQVSEGLVLSLSCWEADQSPPAWARALQTALTEMSDRIFSHWGWALAGMLPGGHTEMLVGLAAEIAGMFAWVVSHVRNEDDLSCARVILLDQYDLALMARGKLRTWDFNGDGHHLLTVKYSGDMVPFPVGALEYAVRTGSGLTAAWSVPVTLPWDSMTAPALASFKGKLHCVYVRPDQAVMWTVMDGTTWSEPQQIHGWASLYAVALCEFSGKLHLALTGKDDVLRWATTSNGTSWTEVTSVPSKAERAPALAVGDLDVYLWMNHSGPDGRLNTHWHHKTWTSWRGSWGDNLGWIVTRPAAMARYKGRLWRIATGTDQRMYAATGTSKLYGTEVRPHWTNVGTVNAWPSTHGPALAVHQDDLWVFHRDTEGALRFCRESQHWGALGHVSWQAPAKPMDEPSAASHNSKLYVMYRR